MMSKTLVVVDAQMATGFAQVLCQALRDRGRSPTRFALEDHAGRSLYSWSAEGGEIIAPDAMETAEARVFVPADQVTCERVARREPTGRPRARVARDAIVAQAAAARRMWCQATAASQGVVAFVVRGAAAIGEAASTLIRLVRVGPSLRWGAAIAVVGALVLSSEPILRTLRAASPARSAEVAFEPGFGALRSSLNDGLPDVECAKRMAAGATFETAAAASATP